ncbi:MAG: YwaF family protein [Bacteroidales bacterium]|nr:YwaF family protein [Bacteroidales bacterium]
MSLIIALVVALAGSLATFFFARHKDFSLGKKIFSFALIVVFIARYISYDDQILNIVSLASGPFTPAINFFAYFGIWLELTLVVLLMLYPFFKVRILTNLIKFVLTPGFVLYLGFSYYSVYLQLIGNTGNLFSLSFQSAMFAVEIAAVAYGLFLVWRDDYSIKLSKKDIVSLLIAIIPVLLASLPIYGPQFVIGNVNARYEVIDISFAHRLFIYGSIIIPFILYFSLKKKDEEFIRFAMVYLSVATMITFSRVFYYQNFFEPWTWPIHLCNTAMYIIPLVLIFRLDKLFYFTYFINVFGALMAMLMPNYSASTNLTSWVIIQFWYNHSLAFFMPLLLVALKLFPRPKMKQMYYSLIAFSGYFLLVMVLNVWFSNYAATDFFFINSDFIVDKLGRWAENIFNISFSFNIGALTFEFHPVYQALFLLVYVGVSFAMWFVYSLGFSIADSLGDLRMRQKRIKLDKFALLAALNGRGLDEPMEQNTGVRLELKNFSKRYGRNKDFAVRDASLIVNGGEIFGFLGPNGAGKSTTIKSIVGIQTITEGSISICGYDVEKQPVMAKRLIGYVPDHYALYEKLTAREYVNYIADIYGVTSEERQERIPHYVNLFHLEEAFDNQIKTFSHGMKQKVTIIAALVHEPKLWLLDEPLTGLDPDSIYQVKECMRQHAAKGNIVMFSSHIIDVVENLCQRIAVIKKGHLFAPMTIKEVHEQGTLEEYYLKMAIHEATPELKEDKETA